jgi:hypothetical protein
MDYDMKSKGGVVLAQNGRQVALIFECADDYEAIRFVEYLALGMREGQLRLDLFNPGGWHNVKEG